MARRDERARRRRPRHGARARHRDDRVGGRTLEGTRRGARSRSASRAGLPPSPRRRRRRDADEGEAEACDARRRRVDEARRDRTPPARRSSRERPSFVVDGRARARRRPTSAVLRRGGARARLSPARSVWHYVFPREPNHQMLEWLSATAPTAMNAMNADRRRSDQRRRRPRSKPTVASAVADRGGVDMIRNLRARYRYTRMRSQSSTTGLARARARFEIVRSDRQPQRQDLERYPSETNQNICGMTEANSNDRGTAARTRSRARRRARARRGSSLPRRASHTVSSRFPRARSGAGRRGRGARERTPGRHRTRRRSEARSSTVPAGI